MYTFCQNDLPKLDPQIDCVSAWQTQWESYCNLSGLEKEDIQKQFKALMLCFSIETITIVQNLGLNEVQMKNKSNAVTFDEEYKCLESHLTTF